MNLDVGNVCVREVVVARGTEKVTTVAKLMHEHHVGDVVIVDNREGVNYPTGIVTDRDIVLEGVVAALDRLPELVADDLVKRPLLAVQEGYTVDHALELMREQGVRRAPVVDAKGALVGILALDDVIELFAGRLATMAKIVSREQRMERDYRP